MENESKPIGGDGAETRRRPLFTKLIDRMKQAIDSVAIRASRGGDTRTTTALRGSEKLVESMEEADNPPTVPSSN